MEPVFVVLRTIIKMFKNKYNDKSYRQILFKFVQNIDNKGLHFSFKFDNDPIFR